MKREIKLYNVLFPVWLFYLLPTYLWLLILPGNFLIDSLVLIIAARCCGLSEKRTLWKRTILPVWGIGFAADFAGAALTFGLMVLLNSNLPNLDTFRIPGGQLLVLPGILLAAVLIYVLDRLVLLRHRLEKSDAHRLALALAIFTAPYTMLIPVEWIYSFH